ncbi:MAG TPA: hypothetical protein VJ783_09930 [Pirellulales bacterium]|nr:hypothetical protein [Pirellulales bacterium]
MLPRDQRSRFAAATEPRFGGPDYWDRWARRLALAGRQSPAPNSAAEITLRSSANAQKAQVRCFRARIMANLERLIDELHQEAERVNEQAVEGLLFTESV